MKPTKKLLTFSLSALAVLIHHANAQSTWTGSTSTAWGNSANWSPSAPGSGDNVIIANTTTNSTLNLDGADRTVGSITYGDTGTRNTPLFTFLTGGNTLTVKGGINATGPLTGGVGFSLNGNTTIDGDQIWTVGGDLGAVNTDRGLRLAADGTNKTVTLDGDLTKEGSGQLLLANLTIGGAGNFIINEGALKINGSSSSLITVGGTGSIEMNNSSILMMARNTGTMSVTRDIVMNDTSALHFGGGGSGASAAVVADIAWNGTHALTAVNNNPFDFSGAWSGSGTINRTVGGQTLTISGDNTGFSGALNLGSGTTTLSGDFTGTSTIALSAGTNNLSGTFGGNTINVSGGTNTFSGDLGDSAVTLTGNGVIRAEGTSTALGAGTVKLESTGGTSRVTLAGVTTSANFTIDSAALTNFQGAITALDEVGNSAVNGDITVLRAVGNGGHLAALGSRVLTLNGELNVGGSQANITHRLGTIVYAGGGTSQHTLQVTGTARLGADQGLSQGTIVNLGVSGGATLDLNGFDQTLRGVIRTTSNAATVTNSNSTASVLTLNNSTSDLSFAGIIQNGAGGVSLVKEGSNTFNLIGANTYTGETLVSAGTLLVTGSLGNTEVKVSAAAAVGGTGSIGGTLHFEADSFLTIADLADPLAVTGSVTFAAGFGIENVLGVNWLELDMHTPYTLLTNSTDFSTAGLDNFGAANAYDLGGGRSVFFQNGSLQVIVIPEPQTALLGGLGILLLLRRRR